MGRTSREVGHPFYTVSGMMPVSREEADFCRRRVGGLLNWSDLMTTPLADVLANAYYLGLKDATEYAAQPGETGR